MKEKKKITVTFYFQKMRKNFRFSLAIKPAGACQLYERQKGEK